MIAQFVDTMILAPTGISGFHEPSNSKSWIVLENCFQPPYIM